MKPRKSLTKTVDRLTKLLMKSQDIVWGSEISAGAFVKPKDITKYSKWPRCVLIAVFHSSPILYSHQMLALLRFNLVKTVALLEQLKNRSKQGHLFFVVILNHGSWYSGKGTCLSSLQRKNLCIGDNEGQIIPCANESVMYNPWLHVLSVEQSFAL